MNPDFIACKSFGFLLQDSLSFNLLSRNVTRLPPYLDEICESSSQTCRSLMTNYTQRIVEQGVCAQDLLPMSLNQYAYHAYIDFLTYPVMQDVGCAKDPGTAQYCYVETLGGCELTYFDVNNGGDGDIALSVPIFIKPSPPY